MADKKINSIYSSKDLELLSSLLAPSQQSHTKNVANISDQIFNQLGNTKLNKDIIDKAILLHDIAKDINANKHGKISSDFIRKSGILNDVKSKKLIEFIVNQHPGKSMPDLSQFSKKDIQQLKGLLPLMRISDTLSRGSFEQLPIVFGKSGKMKLTTKDLGLSGKKMDRLLSSITMFNKKGFANGGSVEDLKRLIQKSGGTYSNDLRMLQSAGITSKQIEDLMKFAQVNPEAAKVLQGITGVKGGQSPIIRNQKELSLIRSAFLTQHTKESLVTLQNLVGKYGEDAVKSAGYFSRQKGLTSNPAKLRDALKESFTGGNKFRGRPVFDPVFKKLGSSTGVIYSGVAHQLKFLESLRSTGQNIEGYRQNIQGSRIRGGVDWSSLVPSLGRISTTGTRGIQSPIGDISNMMGMISGRQKFIQNTPSNISKFLPSSRPSSKGGSNYSLLSMLSPSRQSHQYGIMDKLRAYKKDIMSYALQGAGVGGFLGLGAHLVGSVLSSGIPMPFAQGGKIVGRGTSISDSIPANLTPGSYVLDKDTVQALGNNFLSNVTGNSTYKGLASGGYGTNALISNGEWVLNPQQANAMGGSKVLDKLRGFSNDRILSRTERSKLFANGGRIPGFYDGGNFSVNDIKKKITTERSAIESLIKGDLTGVIGESVPELKGLNYNQLFGKSLISPGNTKIPLMKGASQQTANAEAIVKKTEEEKVALTKYIRSVNEAAKAHEKEKIATEAATQSTTKNKLSGVFGGQPPNNNGMLGKIGTTSKDISWKAASLSMSSMGVYFSLMGIFMALSSAVTSLTSSLSDLNNVFKNVGYVNAFAGGAKKANDILGTFKVTQSDLVTGWKNVTYAQSVFGLSMSALSASIFKDKKFTDSLVGSISTLFTRLQDKQVTASFTKFLDAAAKSLPEVVDALKGVTDILSVAAEHPGLIKLAAQMYGLTLLLQPLTSGVSLVFSAFGQGATAIETVVNLNKSVMLLNSSIGKTAFFALEAMVAIEALSRTYQMLTGQETPWWTKPITTGLNLATGNMEGVTSGTFMGYASGGEITGQQTAAIDDKTIRVEEGEYVINKKSARRLGKTTLDQLNKFANGGVTGNTSIPLLSNISAINKSNSDYFNFKTINLQDDNLTQSKTTAKVLNNAAETDGIGVYVRNWKGNWDAKGSTATGGNELPFEMGLPNRYLYGLGTPVSGIGNGINPNVNPNTSVNPNLNPNINVTPNFNPNPNANPMSASILGYVEQVLANISESVKSNFNSIRDSIIKSIENIQSTITGYAAKAKELATTLTTPSTYTGIAKNLGTSVTGAVSTIGTGIVSGMGGRTGSYFATDTYAQHAGYRQYGDVTNYGPTGTRNAGFWDRFVSGKNTYGQMPGQGARRGFGPAQQGTTGRDIWTGKEIAIPDFVDLLPVFADINRNKDPYSAALNLGSQVTGNVATGYMGRGLQRGAQSVPAWLANKFGTGVGRNLAFSGVGKGLAGAGTLFTDFMKLAGAPEVVGATGFAEGGQANQQFMQGRSLDDIIQGNQNAASGVFTGNVISTGYGRGMQTWGKLFGLNEQQMRSSLNQNQGLMSTGAGPGTFLSKAAEGLGVLDNYNEFFDKLKGGNEAVSNILSSASYNVGGNDVGKFLGQGAGALNAGVYDTIASLANLNVGSMFGTGTGIMGTGVSLAEMGVTLASDVSQNPLALASLGMTGLIPGVGPLLAATTMPQTTSWLAGTQDVINQQPAQLGYTGMQTVSYDELNNANTSLETFYNTLSGINNLLSPKTETDLNTYGMSYVSAGDTSQTIPAVLSQAEQQTPQTQPVDMNVNVTVDVRGDDSNAIAAKVKTDLNSTLENTIKGIVKQFIPTLSKL